MRCSKVRKSMSEYIDLRLTTEERADVLLHLEQCPGCKALYEETEKLCGFLHGLQDTEVPTTLASKIDRIPWEFEQDFSSRFSFKFGWTLAAAAAMAAFLIIKPSPLGDSTAPTIAVVAEETLSDQAVELMEVRTLLLPEERSVSEPVQWVRVPMSRGVPLDRVSQTHDSPAERDDRDDKIWQEVRRVSVCSRRSF